MPPSLLVEEVVGLGLVRLAGPVDRGLEAEFLEERFEQLVPQRVLVLAAPASLGVPQKIADEGEHLGGVVPPGRVFAQAIPQEIVGEQAPVLEVFAGVGGGIEHAAELVELLQGILAGPGESPQGPQVQPGGAAAVDADRLGHDLDALAASRPFLLSFPLVEEHELQRVEVRSQDQHVVDVALAQDAHEVVADLGRQRLRLGEDDPQELLGVFGKKLDPLDGTGRFAGKPHGLGRQSGPVGGVVPELRQERRDCVRRGKLGDFLGRQIKVRGRNHAAHRASSPGRTATRNSSQQAGSPCQRVDKPMQASYAEQTYLATVEDEKCDSANEFENCDRPRS